MPVEMYGWAPFHDSLNLSAKGAGVVPLVLKYVFPRRTCKKNSPPFGELFFLYVDWRLAKVLFSYLVLTYSFMGLTMYSL